MATDRGPSDAGKRSIGRRRTVLMIAFHFPPLEGGSGLFRTLNFARYLPEHGWRPVVLTVDPRVYRRVGRSDNGVVSSERIEVHRTACLDAARDLRVRGYYPSVAAVPDRWSSWFPTAVPRGLRIARDRGADVIWSTYPIATAHWIGAALARWTDLPWVADFRDPMCQPGYPEDPLQYRAFEWIERAAVRRASAVVFTAPGAIRDYRGRYPQHDDGRFDLILNGYDDDLFADPVPDGSGGERGRGPRVLVHSGTVYPSERDPTHLFEALAALHRAGEVSAGDLRIRLRATGHDRFLREEIERLGIGDLVELAPPVAPRDAVREMRAADGLLVLQADNCDAQIPAKLYEYLRSGRPVIALTNPRGDTGWLLSSRGIPVAAPLDDAAAIRDVLRGLARDWANAASRFVPAGPVDDLSRRSQTAELARVLDRVRRRGAGGVR